MKNRNTDTGRRLQFSVLATFFVLFICTIPLVGSGYEKQQTINVQDLIQALKPGDKMPDSFWDMPMELDNFRGKKSQFKFGDMKGRIIIFDFWATTCKSCIEGIPHMEQIQEKYPNELAIILVNSKRNKDTPGRIKTTMQRYKESYKYDISLFTILDDTLLTTLFPHNAIPTTAWINQNGIYMGNTSSREVTVKNIESVLKTGKAALSVERVYRNFDDRRKTPPLKDTVGAQFISEITNYIPFYLPTYPNVIRKNGNSHYQMVNNSFSFMLSEAYKKELNGLTWTDYVLDPGIANDIKYKLLNSLDNNNIFSYQLYVRDSISQIQAEAYLQKAFAKRFKIKAERRKGNVEVYQVSYNANFDKIKTKGEIPIVQPYPGSDPEQYRNAAISQFLTNLFYYLDKPLVYDRTDNQLIDIVLPADFGKRSIAERLLFLEDHGIKLTPVRMNREYAYLSPL